MTIRSGRRIPLLGIDLNKHPVMPLFIDWFQRAKHVWNETGEH